MKSKATKGLKGKADREFSLAIRTIGRCEFCGKRDTLQCMHIISRRYAQTRTSFRNAYCGCAGCHLKYTANPLLFAEKVLESNLGPYVESERLKAYSTTAPKVDWQDRYEIARLITSKQFTVEDARTDDI